MSNDFSYGKLEKLKSKKLTDAVFATGRSFTVFPLKIFYLTVPEKLDFCIKVGVGASGRYFKKAVDRNRIKRLLREAYRTQKTHIHHFLQQKNTQVATFILYVGREVPSFTAIKEKMAPALQRLIKELNETLVKNT